MNAPFRPEGPKVITFGCRLNAHESEGVAAQARQDGLRAGTIINTCAVTAEAVRQARQAARRAHREVAGPVIVTGCAAEVDAEAFAGMAEVDLVVANSMKRRAGAYGPGALAQGRVVADGTPAAAGEAPARSPAGRLNAAGLRARATVEVQNGCDHRCTFCIIPFGRGASRSAPAGRVIERVREQLDAGAREVVLTGVDLTAWGADLEGAPSLGALVAAILREAPELPRLRLSSIDAAEIDPELLAAFADPRLMPHLHLSLQAGSDLILKRMRRRHLRADALRLMEEVRRMRPETAFGADLIAGFPTEDEAMAAESLALIAEAGLSYVHIFPFSPRPGTPAARMPQLDRGIVRDRAEALRAAADAALERHLAARVGRTLKALVEEPGRARAEDFTEIRFEHPATPGELGRFQIAAHDGRRALGYRVQDEWEDARTPGEAPV